MPLDDRAATLRIVREQPSRARLTLRCARSANGTVEITSSLIAQPELWRGRQVGEWTVQEHQQLALGLTAYGRDWGRIQSLVVPSRSALEVHARTHMVCPKRHRVCVLT